MSIPIGRRDLRVPLALLGIAILIVAMSALMAGISSAAMVVGWPPP